MTTASICTGVFGHHSWADLAWSRTKPSAEAQIPQTEYVLVHGSTLQDARNTAAERAKGEWLIFADADDELAPGYVEAILKGSADLRSPAIQYIYPDHEEAPKLLKPKNLRRGNYLPIGTAIRRELFMEVGGFRELPAWEDWDLAVRCYLRGATIEQIPEAVYRAYWSPTGRNNLTQQQAVNLMRRLRRDHALEERRLKR